LFTIPNRYALAEEVTLDIREQRMEKDSDHVDQPSSSKGHDKKRKPIIPSFYSKTKYPSYA
jgi:hypothetical protein